MGAVTVVTTRVVVVPPIHHGWGGRDRGRGGVGFRHGLGVGEGRGKVLGVGLQGSWGDGDAVPLLSVLGDRVLYIFGHRIIEKMFVWELCLQSLDVTSVAEQVIVQWIAAFVGFICQLNSAVLAMVTIHMEVFVHGHHPHSLLGTLYWGYSLATCCTLGRIHSVIVGDAVDLVVYVDGEGDSIQAVIAHTASEAARVIGLPHGL